MSLNLENSPLALVQPLESVTTKTVSKSRRSVSGTEIYGNMFDEEYLGALATAEVAYDVYDKMFRSDYQIKRVMWAMMSPILSGSFEYEPIDDKDQKQVKQALFKNRLWNVNTIDKWNNTLFQILSYLQFGFGVFEPYGHVVKDRELGTIITLKSIGLLRQSTIKEWDIVDGEVKRVRQCANRNGEFFDEWISGKRLKFLTNMKLGDNYEGISVLRSIYGNYIRKDLLLRLDMIGNEKMAVGTPIVFVSKATLDNPTKMDKLEDMLESYCAHEKNYMILDKELKGRKDEEPGFRIEKGVYDSKSVQDAIQREDTKMMDAILASFLDIGVYRSGGNSQNEGQMKVFLNSLMSIAEYICEFRDEIAHEYYVANYGEPEVRLDTKISGITLDDKQKTMEIIRGYVQSDVIRPDEPLEKEFRRNLGLPEKDPSTERETVANPDKNTFRTKPGDEKPQKKPNKAKTDE